MNDRKRELLKEKAVFLNIVLTKRCHSNCRSCMFGCNPRLTRGLTLDYDFEQLKRDLKLIRNFNLKDVVVLGGEVLELDEDMLLKYLRLIRDSLPGVPLNLLTNGYRFIDFKPVIELGYSIIISKYPRTVLRADNKNFFYHTDDHSPENRDLFVLSTLSRTKHENLFKTCKSDCASLFNGRVYGCGMALSIEGKNKNLNATFPDFSIPVEDFTLDFLSRSSELCSYCDVPRNYQEKKFIRWQQKFNPRDFLS